MKRKVDKTKKANIKCEHCGYWNFATGICLLKNEQKNYWNRCKCFDWKETEK